MTEPVDPELIALATPYALHAVSESELADIERRVLAAPAPVALAFTAEVRAVREAMAVLSAGTALEPPAQLRDQLLATVAKDSESWGPSRAPRWRTAVLAAAAALVVGLGALGVGWVLRPPPTPSTAAQVFAAHDVRTVSGNIPTGGTATVVFSREKNAGVLVMNNVAPPVPGTVYQMWLIGDKGPQSAGTMDAKTVAPSTTAVLPDITNSKALAFTVEPGTGSPHPTGNVFAELPLT
jgi:anti-sigma-K factor RskA